MNQALKDQTKETLAKAENLLESSDLVKLQTELKNAQTPTFDPDFWQKPEAQSIMQSVSIIQGKIDQHQEVVKAKDDVQALVDLSADANPNQESELTSELETKLKQLESLLKKMELSKYLSGKYDHLGALLSIHPGQGGTEAMDWAEMLQRMFQRYFERKDWKYKLTSESRGEEAGIKEASYEITAPYAFGYLKGEAGTHRLVRLSPFNADNLRQTSFALVEILPLVEDSAEIEIKDDELEWKFTRAGGAGGQNVNKVNTAVELTHIPSGLVVKCREERSQIQNKERALRILRAKLALQEEEKQAEELAAVKGEHTNASWGNQIRNYVLHPYQLVKDTRTKVETSDTTGVLDGDLDQFILEEVKLGK